jgi:hypothetical protein
MYPTPVPFQTCSSGKGIDRRTGIALPILISGSRIKCVVSATPHALYPQEGDLVYIAKFFEVW